jgi:hypothetical protein
MADHGEFREEFHGEHPHSYDRAEPKYSIIWIFGITTVVMLVFIGIGVQMYYERVESTAVQDMVLSQDSWQLGDLRSKENWELSHYSHYDKTKGTMRIPIEQAMKLVAQEAATGQFKYPTNPYAVKTAADLAATGATPAVSQPGAAAMSGSQNQGVTSSPNVQQPTPPTQPNK